MDVRQSCGFAKKAFPRKSKHVTQLDGFGPPNIDLAPIYVLFDHPLHKMLLQVEVHHSYLMSIHCFWSLWSTAKIRELLSNVGAKNRSRRDHQSCWVRPSPNASRNHSCYPTSVGVMRVTGCIQNMICSPEPGRICSCPQIFRSDLVSMGQSWEQTVVVDYANYIKLPNL